MRFMIIVKASAESEAGVMPEQRVFDAMADYHVELKKAGVLLAATGLQPTSKGFRIKYSGSKRSFVDGPFAETKELIAGYTLIRSNRKKKRWSGHDGSRTPAMWTARSKSGRSTRWTTCRQARPWIGSATS